MNASRHRLVFAAACAGMLLFGIALTTLGAVLPSIIRRLPTPGHPNRPTA